MDVMHLIEKALNIRAQYHKVISGNIANVETPGFKEKDIDFGKELGKNLDSNSRGFLAGDLDVTESPTNDGLASIDGNTVSMEGQIVKLTENQLMYHTLVQVAAKRYSIMRYVISEGRK